MWPEILCGLSVRPVPASALWQLASQHGAGDFLFQKKSKWVVVPANVLGGVPLGSTQAGSIEQMSDNINRLKIVPDDISCSQKVIAVLPTWYMYCAFSMFRLKD